MVAFTIFYFDISGVGGRFEQLTLKPHEKQFTADSIAKLPIQGTPEGKKVFVATLITMLPAHKPGEKRPSNKVTLINALADLLKNNKIVDDQLDDQLVAILGKLLSFCNLNYLSN